MRNFLVAGNWKMNTDAESAASLAEALASQAGSADPSVEVLVCPPFVYLPGVRTALGDSAIALGAQNCYFEESGAFTGEVSVGMLKDIGCSSVILGHSERRHVLGESDDLINKKVKAALAGGLTAVLCVGELLSEREAEKTEAVLDAQMAGGLAGVIADDMANVVIAYEPVWAIGTGVTATTEQAESAHIYLRNWLKGHYNDAIADATRILYGGSVKPSNAQSLMEQPNVDGALVGGASLSAENFVPIIEAAKAVAAG